MSRAMIDYQGYDLYIDMIYNLHPDGQVMFIHYHDYYEPLRDPKCDIPKGQLIVHTVKDKKTFDRIKFEFIKHIKKHPNPEERVADWEWRTKDNLPDWDKFDRLVERRKTRTEKAQEFKEELEIKQKCEEYGIEYHGPLKENY